MNFLLFCVNMSENESVNLLCSLEACIDQVNGLLGFHRLNLRLSCEYKKNENA